MPTATPDLWSATGAFARHFPNYTPRPQQQAMYQAVTECLHSGTDLIVEAGTGTGKSLAYLAPLILMAARDPEFRSVVSTATIGLQQQLAEQDVPHALAALVQAGLIKPAQFRWATLKGRGNYLCRQRAAEFSEQHTGPERESANRLARKIADWDTATGDVAEINLLPDERYPWSLASAQHYRDCLYYQAEAPAQPQCFLKAARQQAQDAHLVIVNHALFFADLANTESQLGQTTHVILDEAQHIEEIASRQFGWELTPTDLTRTLEELLEHPTLGASAQETLNRWEQLWTALTECAPEPQYREDSNTVTVTPRLRQSRAWPAVSAAATALANASANLSQTVNNAASHAMAGLDTNAERALRPVLDELETHRQRVGLLTAPDTPEHIIWLENRQQHELKVNCVPLHVGPLLEETLFDRKLATILTSATITTGPNEFQLIREQTGFPPEGRQLGLSSPFDYRKQAQFMSPADLPNPRLFREFSAAVAQCLGDVAEHLNGHTLALFTSYAALNDCAQKLRERLQDTGLHVSAQGRDGPPDAIITRFRANPRGIILGAASFWEGVDLGDLLQAVAICRLPFPVPTDPIVAARSAQYSDPFRHYHLPMAVLRFRQGCGRLIRSQNSVGSIIVLDPRIRNGKYGARFYESLPPCRPIRSTMHNLGQLATQWINSTPSRPLARHP